MKVLRRRVTRITIGMAKVPLNCRRIVGLQDVKIIISGYNNAISDFASYRFLLKIGKKGTTFMV